MTPPFQLAEGEEVWRGHTLTKTSLPTHISLVRASHVTPHLDARELGKLSPGWDATVQRLCTKERAFGQLFIFPTYLDLVSFKREENAKDWKLR